MKTNNLIKRLRGEDIKKLLQTNNINSISLIWSYSRWEQKKDSDIDLIFNLDNNSKITLLKLINIKQKLEEKLNKTVDLVEESSINKHYRHSIIKDQKVIF